MEIDPALSLLVPASPQQPQTHPIDRHYFPEISLGPDLLKEDFPALSDSWTRKAYESFKSRTTMGGVHGRPRRGSKAIKEDNENVMMTFVQDKNGVPVDGETAKAIRARAADLFSTIATLREDCVAATWGQVDSNSKDFFYAKICQFWPDLRMCAFNWKANAVGAIVYPRWYKRFKLEKQRKRQLENDEEDGQNKRQRKLGPSPPSSFPQLRSLSQSPPPPSLPPSPIVSSSEATTTDSPSDTPTSSQQIIPFIDDPFADRPVSAIPTTLTARLLAVRGPAGPTPTPGTSLVTPTSSTAGATSSKKKRPNNTLSAKNLFLIDYYETHDPVSNDEFKQLWESLPQDQQKAWETKSREAHNAKKAAENGPA